MNEALKAESAYMNWGRDGVSLGVADFSAEV